MKNSLLGLVTPNWTATRDQLKWPLIHLFAVFSICLAISISAAVLYFGNGLQIPTAISIISTVLVVLVPVVGVFLPTEVLYDIMQCSLRVLGLGISFFFVAFYSTGGSPDPFQNGPLMVSFTIFSIGLYGTVALGILWAVQFARKGTSGVETDFQ
jgi:hypothetical protein